MKNQKALKVHYQENIFHIFPYKEALKISHKTIISHTAWEMNPERATWKGTMSVLCAAKNMKKNEEKSLWHSQ